MQNIINTVKGTVLGVAGFMTPVLKESRFKETGVVTPLEFVTAGDHLVHTCPTWQWACGDDCKTKPYLPKNKQYLITRNVPCLRRYKQAENYDIQENIIESEEGIEGWVETHHYDSSHSKLNEKIPDLSTKDSVDNDQTSKTAATENKNIRTNLGDDSDSDNSDEREAIDMDAFVESGFLEDDSAISSSDIQAGVISSSNDSILKTRTYDLHITYDKFYQTPRLWLYGYSENRVPLRVKEIYQDVSQDYAKKTVTMESHPHIPGPPMASIHPCKHADIMKKLIKMATRGGKNINIHMYLIIFLKFVQSVIPTIDYDYTQNISI